jgi:elongation factor Ts
MSNIDLIKQLRSETGAGIADVKQALEISKNDLDGARAYLNKKGMANADKRADREANQGIIAHYIHNTSRIGVLVEVNCETDFVARSEDFIEFGKNIAMQVCALSPRYVDENEIPETIKEEFAKEVAADPKFSSKPEAVKAKIIEDKVKAYAGDTCLLKQAFFKDSSVTVQDMLKTLSGKVGEAVKIKRFVRFEIGN